MHFFIWRVLPSLPRERTASADAAPPFCPADAHTQHAHTRTQNTQHTRTNTQTRQTPSPFSPADAHTLSQTHTHTQHARTHARQMPAPAVSDAALASTAVWVSYCRRPGDSNCIQVSGPPPAPPRTGPARPSLNRPGLAWPGRYWSRSRGRISAPDGARWGGPADSARVRGARVRLHAPRRVCVSGQWRGGPVGGAPRRAPACASCA